MSNELRPSQLNVEARLRSRGIRVTTYAVLILEHLAEAGPAGMTAHDLLRALIDRHGGLGTIGSIYRNLARFAQSGIVERIAVPKGHDIFAMPAHAQHLGRGTPLYRKTLPALSMLP